MEMGSIGEGATPLMYACQQGNEKNCLNILAKTPSAARQRDRTQKTPLHYCAENIHTDCAEAILRVASDVVNARDEDGYSPLHLAVIAGNKPLIQLLLSRGADVNALDNEKHSVVHWATVCGEQEALEMVIQSGAGISSPDIHGGFPLHYAAQMCGPGADMRGDARAGLAVLRTLLACGADVDEQDKDGRQPILWAASAGSAEAILALVKAGAKVETADKDGLTALHCAASRGHTDCLETLVALCGAHVDTIDVNGCTALFYAATLGHADATQMLLNLGAEPNRQDRKGRTPAHCGAAKGQLETLRLLLAGGANLWLRNVKGDLPLHEAVLSGRRELVTWLLNQRPESVNVANNDGKCPIHVASVNNYVEIVKILLDAGSLVNPVMRSNKGGMLTPLDAALLRGHRNCAKFLQLHGGVPRNKLSDTSAALRGQLHKDYVGEAELLASLPMSGISALTVSPRILHEKTIQKRLANEDLAIRHIEPILVPERSGRYFDEESSEDEQRQKRRRRRRKSERRRRESPEISDSNDDISEDSSTRVRKKSVRTRSTSEHRKSSEGAGMQRRRKSPANSESQEELSNSPKEKEAFSVAEESATNELDSKPDLESVTKVEPKNGEKANVPAKAKNGKENIVKSEKAKKAKNVVKKPEKGKQKNVVEEKGKGKETEQVLKTDVTPDTEAPKPSSVVPTVVLPETVVSQNTERSQLVNQHDSSLEDNVTSLPLTVQVEAEIHQPLIPKEDDLPQETKIDVSDDTEHVTEAEVAVEPPTSEKVPSVEEKEPENMNGSSIELNKLEESNLTKKDLDDENQIEKNSSVIEDNVEVINLDSPTNSRPITARRRSIVLTTNETKDTNVESEDSHAFNLNNEVAFFKIEENDSSVRRRSADGSEGHDGGEEPTNTLRDRRSSIMFGENVLEESNFKRTRRKSDVGIGKSDRIGRVDLVLPRTDSEERDELALREGDVDTVIKNVYLGEPKFLSGSAGDESGGSTRYEDSSAMPDSGIEPSPRRDRSSPVSPDGRVPRLCRKGRGHQPSAPISVTRSVQNTIRKYHLERKIFYQLLELKRLQIRAGRANEQVLVKRLVDDYQRAGHVAGLHQYTGVYSFRQFEHFLYDQLHTLQSGSQLVIPQLKPNDDIETLSAVLKRTRAELQEAALDNPALCTHSTHRCSHAAHAYTGIPCAAYITKLNHHTMPKENKSGFLPRIDSSLADGRRRGSQLKRMDRPVTLELIHGREKQVISLPTERLDRSKRYYVTFTIKGGATPPKKESSGTEGVTSHLHAKTV